VTAVTTAPAPAEEPGRPICGEKHPTSKAVICTRDAGHKGGHKNPAQYWQATEATP
jgi:hypothetical protein